MVTVHTEVRSHKTAYNTLYKTRLRGWEVIRNISGRQTHPQPGPVETAVEAQQLGLCLAARQFGSSSMGSSSFTFIAHGLVIA